MTETIIKNALVFSGRNEEARYVDISIRDEKIHAIASNIKSENAIQIDAKGKYLSPGFIDPHASTGFGYFFENYAEHKLFQGITTEIIGNCGTSPAPIGPELEETMHGLSKQLQFNYDWKSLSEYDERIIENLQFNMATLVGHSTLRAGFVRDWKKTEASELEDMKHSLSEAMEQGALGLSTGLIYTPGCFAETSEIIELARLVKKHSGLYASHIRNERDGLEEAVEEALEIGQKADIRVLISHLKAAEKRNWGKIPNILERLEKYNASGGEVAVDVYPYTAVSTKLRAFIPKNLLANGIAQMQKEILEKSVLEAIEKWILERNYDLEQMIIISAELPEMAGKSVAEISALRSEKAAETIATILHINPEAWIVYHCISQADIDAAIRWDKAMICTDSWSHPINSPIHIGKPHPRSYGAFSEFLERYVLQKKYLSWQEAIHKITLKTAQYFNLSDRGEITLGKRADLILFDPKKLKVNASYMNPKLLSEGIEDIWINGKHIMKNAQLSSAKAGQILKRQVL